MSGVVLAVVAVWSVASAASPLAQAGKKSVEDAYASLAAASVPPAPKLGPGAAPLIVPLPTDGSDVLQPGVSSGAFVTIAAGAGTIVQSTLGPPGVADASFSNSWYENTASDIVEAYAGGLTGSPGQGIVVVAIWDATHADWLAGGRYVAPAGIGKLTIVSATGELLTLQDPSGATVTFNPRTGTFR